MNSQIFLGDCLHVMEDLPDNCIDMVFCDLPYGTTQNKWDSIIPFDDLWRAYNRVVKENGAVVLTSQQPFTSKLIVSNPNQFRFRNFPSTQSHKSNKSDRRLPYPEYPQPNQESPSFQDKLQAKVSP